MTRQHSQEERRTHTERIWRRRHPQGDRQDQHRCQQLRHQHSEEERDISVRNNKEEGRSVNFTQNLVLHDGYGFSWGQEKRKSIRKKRLPFSILEGFYTKLSDHGDYRAYSKSSQNFPFVVRITSVDPAYCAWKNIVKKYIISILDIIFLILVW